MMQLPLGAGPVVGWRKTMLPRAEGVGRARAMWPLDLSLSLSEMGVCLWPAAFLP